MTNLIKNSEVSKAKTEKSREEKLKEYKRLLDFWTKDEKKHLKELEKHKFKRLNNQSQLMREGLHGVNSRALIEDIHEENIKEAKDFYEGKKDYYNQKIKELEYEI